MYDRMTHLLLIGSNLSQANRWAFGLAIGQKSWWQNYQPLKTPNLLGVTNWIFANKKTEPTWKIPMFWICFWKTPMFLKNTYALNIPAFEKSEHPKKITFCTYSPEILTSFPSSQTNFSTVCNFKVSNCCPSWFRRSWNERWNGRRHVLVGGFNLSEKY